MQVFNKVFPFQVCSVSSEEDLIFHCPPSSLSSFHYLDCKVQMEIWKDLKDLLSHTNLFYLRDLDSSRVIIGGYNNDELCVLLFIHISQDA